MPASTEPGRAGDGAEPHYKLLRAWSHETIPAGYRVVVGGYEYFILEKLPAGSKGAEYKYIFRDQMPATEFLRELNSEGAAGYRYVSRMTIGVPEILEREKDSPGYEYRLIKENAKALNEAAAEGFRYIGPRYQHTRSGAYWAKELIVERALKGPEAGEASTSDVKVEYAVSKAYRMSTMRRQVGMLSQSGYCAVHAFQDSYFIVFQKSNASCAYETLAPRQRPPKPKCPWYLACPRESMEDEESHGGYLEQGLSELGARGFHFVGLRLHKPLLERDAGVSRQYEYRVVRAGEQAEALMEQAFSEGFRAVTLDGRNGAYFVVMEKSEGVTRASW